MELSRTGHRLPKAILSHSEANMFINIPDTNDLMGLRDRAILEMLYSTGMRWMELIGLKLMDLDDDRGTLMIRQGKGKKDRMVPVGDRASLRTRKSINEVRPEIAMEPDVAISS